VLRRRVISGIFISAGFVLAAFFVPSIGGFLLILAISSLAQREFYSVIGATGIPVFRLVGLVCGGALITGTFFTIGPDVASCAYNLKWQQLILLVSLVAVFIRQFPQKHNGQPLATIGCTLLGIWYVPFLFNFFTHLVFGFEPVDVMARVGETGRMLVLYLVIVVKCTDMGAFFAGKAFGKHKLVPHLSPAKTREGLVGGIAAGVLASVIFCHAAGMQLGRFELRTVDMIMMGLVLAAAGSAGDLFESLIKRAASVKDSGSSIPGMGGILDVLDSLLFGAPALYVYCALVLA